MGCQGLQAAAAGVQQWSQCGCIEQSEVGDKQSGRERQRKEGRVSLLRGR